jgi:hypothetical protein
MSYSSLTSAPPSPRIESSNQRPPPPANGPPVPTSNGDCVNVKLRPLPSATTHVLPTRRMDTVGSYRPIQPLPLRTISTRWPGSVTVIRSRGVGDAPGAIAGRRRTKERSTSTCESGTSQPTPAAPNPLAPKAICTGSGSPPRGAGKSSGMAAAKLPASLSPVWPVSEGPRSAHRSGRSAQRRGSRPRSSQRTPRATNETARTSPRAARLDSRTSSCHRASAMGAAKRGGR